jgi:hypothetical protein
VPKKPLLIDASPVGLQTARRRSAAANERCIANSQCTPSDQLLLVLID